jgi:hypothetical protein
VLKVFRWDKPLIKVEVESDRVKLYMGNASKGGVCNFCYILGEFDVVGLMVQFLGLSE